MSVILAKPLSPRKRGAGIHCSTMRLLIAVAARFVPSASTRTWYHFSFDGYPLRKDLPAIVTRTVPDEVACFPH